MSRTITPQVILNQTPAVLYRSFTLAGMPRSALASPFWRRLTEMIGKDENVRQEDVAKLFGVGQSAVTKWKTGKGQPKDPRAREMANKYGVCVEWLLMGRGPKFPAGTNDHELAILLAIWDNLTPELRSEVADFAAFKRQSQIPSTVKDPSPIADAKPSKKRR